MRCAQKGCGSYAFNLAHDGVDQGSLCDVHYWQSQANQLKALNAELAAALEVFANKYDAAPDGDLGIGLVNGDFARARAALAKQKETTC